MKALRVYKALKGLRRFQFQFQVSRLDRHYNLKSGTVIISSSRNTREPQEVPGAQVPGCFGRSGINSTGTDRAQNNVEYIQFQASRYKALKGLICPCQGALNHHSTKRYKDLTVENHTFGLLAFVCKRVRAINKLTGPQNKVVLICLIKTT